MKTLTFASLFFVILCFVNQYVCAQSWQQLLNEADSLATSGHNDAAWVVLNEAMSKALTQYNESDTTVALQLYKEGTSVIRYFRDYGEAEMFFTRVLSIKEALLGSDHIDIAEILDNLVAVYMTLNRYSDAQLLVERTLVIREKSYGPDHISVATSLKNLAAIYQDLGKYAEAQELQEKALLIKGREFGQGHPEIAAILNDLGILHYYQGHYVEADSLYMRALRTREELFGHTHQDVAAILHNIAVLYDDQGRYDEAEPVYMRALAIREEIFGPEHKAVAQSLSDLAILKWRTNKYGEAEELHKQSLEIKEKILGKEHPQAAISLNNLANLYYDLGRYAEAEPLQKQALRILENVLGAQHPYVSALLNNLGLLYNNLGKYVEAEPLLERALAIREQSLGPEHSDVAQTLHNLAILHKNQGRYADAEPKYKRALTIWENVLGKEHENVARCQHNLANLYYWQKRYAEAAIYFKRASGIWEKALGSEHPGFANSLSGLAKAYCEQSKYNEAESLYTRALSIRENTLGENHYFVAETLEGMSRFYRMSGNNSQALKCATRASNIRHSNFSRNASVLPENDALVYAQFLRYSVDEYLSSYSDLELKSIDITYHAADLVLSSKGQVSDGIFEREKTIAKEADPKTIALVDTLKLTKHLLSKMFVEGPGECIECYLSETDSLNNLINELEAQLSRQSASYRKRLDYENVSATRIASLLPEMSILIEYFRYQYYQVKPDSTIPRYLAIALARDSGAVLIELGDVSTIDPLIDQYRRHVASISSAARWPTAGDLHSYRRISEKLYKRILQPIEAYLADRDLVLIASDGGLNMISFAALIDGDGKYLVERFPIHYLSAGRDLIRLKDEPQKTSGLFALGDPDFNAPPQARMAERVTAVDTTLEPKSYSMRNVRSECGELNAMTVTSLPGTRREVGQIAEYWEKATEEPAGVFLGTDASEERFKAEASGRRIIHIATHGYFLEGVCRPKISESMLKEDVSFVGENPLLLSGLFLAGANLHGEGADSLGAEDGILTAYEVTAMDLEGTELVVLSACETGLGEVRAGEGVYGLRRAFQMAGAQTVISALWPISDEDTADMMSQLYDRKEESLPEVMRKVQLKRLEKLRKQGVVDHPFTWGSFIALGDWN
jgi:CHAT domain-containing protein/tetratricopeptide (TPR) repeat protein